MGIDLYCGDKNFGCSYGNWHNIRIELIKATFEYLEVHFAVTEYKEGTHEHGSMTALKQYIQKIENGSVIKESIFGNNKSNLLDSFNMYLGLLEFVDLLIEFGVVGIYSLCNKSDCQGFYSIGNSYDICELFKLVKPFLLKNKEDLDAEENWLYRNIDDLIDVFKESVEKNEMVRIS
jgi:hypothetical protein